MTIFPPKAIFVNNFPVYPLYSADIPGILSDMAKKSKKRKSKKISKKDIRNEVTTKMALALKNYKLGNSKKKFRKKLKEIVKIITPLA